MAETHITDIAGRWKTGTTNPTDPVIGDMFYRTDMNGLFRWTGDNWIGRLYTSSSTSTSTTTSTSTSTSTTSTSTSTSSSTSTSTSTSTTG